MAWTAEITDKVQESKTLVAFTVVYSDGATIDTQVYRLNDPAALDKIIRDQITAYEKAATAVDVPLGVVEIKPIELPPPIPAPNPTLVQFRADLVTLRRMLEGVRLGIIAPDDKALAALQGSLKQQYDNDPTTFLAVLPFSPFG